MYDEKQNARWSSIGSSKIAEDPAVREAIDSRAFVAEKSLDKIDEAFKLINQKPVTLSGRTEEVFVEDFHREVAEIKSPVGKANLRLV